MTSTWILFGLAESKLIIYACWFIFSTYLCVTAIFCFVLSKCSKKHVKPCNFQRRKNLPKKQIRSTKFHSFPISTWIVLWKKVFQTDHLKFPWDPCATVRVDSLKIEQIFCNNTTRIYKSLIKHRWRNCCNSGSGKCYYGRILTP